MSCTDPALAAGTGVVVVVVVRRLGVLVGNRYEYQSLISKPPRGKGRTGGAL